MTTTDTTEANATILAVLPIDEVRVREGWNPRTADDDVERDQLPKPADAGLLVAGDRDATDELVAHDLLVFGMQ